MSALVLLNSKDDVATLTKAAKAGESRAHSVSASMAVARGRVDSAPRSMA